MRRRTAIILAILSLFSTGVGGFVTYYEQHEKAAASPIDALVVDPTK